MTREGVGIIDRLGIFADIVKNIVLLQKFRLFNNR